MSQELAAEPANNVVPETTPATEAEAAPLFNQVSMPQSVDLRYPNGYALRLRGVTTVTDIAPNATQPTR